MSHSLLILNRIISSNPNSPIYNSFKFFGRLPDVDEQNFSGHFCVHLHRFFERQTSKILNITKPEKFDDTARYSKMLDSGDKLDEAVGTRKTTFSVRHVSELRYYLLY